MGAGAPHVGRLLALRETVKVRALSLGRPGRRRLLERLEAMQARRLGVQPRRLPEMTMDELYREIKWRIGSASLEEARALAAFLERARR